jgi:hypothetical protein
LYFNELEKYSMETSKLDAVREERCRYYQSAASSVKEHLVLRKIAFAGQAGCKSCKMSPR